MKKHNFFIVYYFCSGAFRSVFVDGVSVSACFDRDSLFAYFFFDSSRLVYYKD